MQRAFYSFYPHYIHLLYVWMTERLRKSDLIYWHQAHQATITDQSTDKPILGVVWSLQKVEYLTSTFDVEISGVSQNQLAARPLSTCFLCSAHHQSLKQEKNLRLLVILGKEFILIQRPAHIQVVQTYL